MDDIHGPSFDAFSVGPMTSQPLSEDRSQEKCQKEQSRKTLMDRVLVTPMKSGRSPSFRSSRQHLKPTTPSRTLRHYSQRISSSHAFAPYPKRSDAENARPPKTPSNKLRRTLSDRSYLNAPTPRTLASPSKKVLLMSRRHLNSPPKRSSKRARRLSRSGPPFMKTQSDSCLDASRWSNFGSMCSSPSTWHTKRHDPDSSKAGGKRSVQDVDLELEFQALQLKDIHEPATNGSFSGYTWPTTNDSPPQSKHRRLSLNSMLSATIPDSWGENVHNFVTHLRSALTEEIQARKQVERQHLWEMQRRVEMEELVIQLQRERESLVQQPPPVSSSPLLLPSSPCTSSKMFATTTLPGPDEGGLANTIIGKLGMS